MIPPSGKVQNLLFWVHLDLIAEAEPATKTLRFYPNQGDGNVKCVS
jgi:hypothetical protein